MRAGACAFQQTLSLEAASVLKHSLSLARRRGHAQVTPLHVAATLLSSRVSLLRRACLKSQPHQASHPLQCRALELCFNVALNRLPATPGPLLHGQPSLSNALIAALKRAQAHQRRGCIEQQQQQPLIAIKVELEQLILSILDDPSVSRVMREAGFSSTAVKTNLEDTSVSSVFQCYNTSGGIYSTPSSPPTETHRELTNPSSFLHSHFLSYSPEQNPLFFSPQKKPLANYFTDSSLSSLKEDVKVVFDVFLRKKRRNAVIIGDSLSITEGLVSELVGKMERGDIPEEMKPAHFIKFQFSSVPLRLMKREEVEVNITDLKRKVESVAPGGGVIIYTGDLKWTIDTASGEREGGHSISSPKEASGYNPVDHLVAEMGKLISWYSNSSTRVWLMATANYQTYVKCQMKQPPLDVQWDLQPVSVPSGGLGLSLNAATSVRDSKISFSENPSQASEKEPFSGGEQDVLNCCPECTSNYEKEIGFTSQQKSSLLSNSCNNKNTENGSAQLPYWLKPRGNDTPEKDDLVELRRKWNRLCQNLHQGRHNQNNISSIISNQGYLGRNYPYSLSYPCFPNQNSIFTESKLLSFADPIVKPIQSVSPFPRFRRQQSCHIEFSFGNGSPKHQSVEPNLDSLKSTDGKDVKITLGLGNSVFPDAVTNEKTEMRNVLQENVPWQSETISSIVGTLMDSRAVNQDTWLFIQGNDSIGKRRLAVGIAKSMFGSSELLLCINMKENTNTPNQNREMLEKALRNQEKIVILVEDVDYADTEFVKFLDERFETSNMKEKDSSHAVFILTKGGSPGYNTSRENADSVIQMKLVVKESAFSSGMPNLNHKRKEEWDSPNYRTKCPRNIEMEVASPDDPENEKREFFKRQLISNILDLNIKADEDEENEGKPVGQFSPISSDSTRETKIDQQIPLRFLEKIKNRYVFNMKSDQDEQAREMFLSKFQSSFQDACGSKNTGRFVMDEMVLKKVLQGCGLFLNSLFEQWLKDIFQTSLVMDDSAGKEGVSIRLCLGKGEGGCAKDGFMGTCLPKRIQLCFIG
ncbi:Double Clp-N motif-containing P-loop nucleoside triphosphate hydrolase superfamily protein [Abeliophyllum distichum]|uniref:Double Clp-N motif-containing P-loop nucleoside triphosphate hydrolase superfamily protein n=1 Tax=Abeliophyllum distichum TaxID=126358 RepID=A0ABD1R240_9LAMI